MRHPKAGWIGTLLGELLTLSLGPTLRSVGSLCRELVHGAVNEALSGAGRALRLYAAILVLAVAAVLALGSALAEGLKALGLPPWASHLIPGLVALAAAALVSPRLEHPPQEAGGAEGNPDGESVPASLFTVNVGGPARRSGRGAPPRRSTPRPRKRRVVEVRPGAGGWEVRSGRGRKAKETFPTQGEALSRALEVARRGSAEVLISSARVPGNGSFQGVA